LLVLSVTADVIPLQTQLLPEFCHLLVATTAT
jgi:hypothetical protein